MANTIDKVDQEQRVDEQVILEKFEKESRTRTFINPLVDKIIMWTAILVTLYHLLYSSGDFMPETLRHRAIHVSAILFLGFAYYPAFRKSSRKVIAWYDYLLMLLSVSIAVYMWINYTSIVDRAANPTTPDIVMGTILVLLVLEASRRITGMALPIIGLCFIIYSLMGVKGGLIKINFPGLFMHRGTSWSSLIGHLFINTEGIYGTSVNVSSTYIFLFIVFGEVMNKCGMGAFFNDLAISVAGGTKGGPAKVSTLAAGLLGMINGSAIANVVTTGSFTIPLMKKTGYSKEFAGAVSATASVGGQLMPPVMGAAAFIMAETLGIQYSQIIVYAAVPAVIYYLGILFQIHMRASKDNLVGLPKDQLPSFKATVMKYWHLIFPIAILMYMLFFSGYTLIFGAYITVIWTIMIAQTREGSRMKLGIKPFVCIAFFLIYLLRIRLLALVLPGVNPLYFDAIWIALLIALIIKSRMSAKDLTGILVSSAKSTVSVAMACACVGIIIGACTKTGFTTNMASAIIRLGKSSLPLTLVFTMVTCMILGMGLPSIPSYIITYTIAVPALIKLGVTDVAAHLFCFYFAMFANITPPVALAAFAAAGISGGDTVKTGVASVKLALAGFLLPYIFIFNSQLLLINTTVLEGLQTAVTSCIGVFLLSAAVEGYMYAPIHPAVRGLSLVGALLLIVPGLKTDLIGLVILIAVVFIQKTLAKKNPPNTGTAVGA
ncbi:MAG: TRAP transporter permease [Fusobacteriaceae bacterium]|jgi:TRAP transporter 4TM/12TM fusion protein|nr:TRAP transporter permease [Fusobacteriaceae bacterium]